MKGKLNLFQTTMLRWRELHPYSAVHVVHVAQPLDAARLRRAINGTLERIGVTGLRLDRATRRYEWEGGRAAAEIRLIGGEGAPPAVVRSEIERQLNLPFATDGRVEPFRFFAVDAGGAFDLGLVYDHFVAGGDSIVLLLRDIVGGYTADAVVDAPAPALYGPTYARLFARQALPLLTGLASLPQIAANCRRAFRPRYAAAEDGYNGFAHFRMEAPEHATLARIAMAWQVSPHDLLLAMLLKALSPQTLQRRSAPRRQELAVASIVNIRRDMGTEAENTLAPYLASFSVSHPVPEEITLRALSAVVHAQTERIKRRKLYLQTLLLMAIAGFEWRFLSIQQRRRFYAKHYPVCAGATALGVDSLWAAGGTAPAPDYLRAVSTGAIAPMIVATTTAGEVVTVGVSFRTTVFARDVVDGIGAHILGSIRALRR